MQSATERYYRALAMARLGDAAKARAEFEALRTAAVEALKALWKALAP